jgi:thioredoxin 1
MENLNKETFKEKIFDFEDKAFPSSRDFKPTIIDFSAEWCGPCKIVAPILENLSKKYDGKIDFYNVDVDENHELSEFFKIKSIPTILFIPNDGPSKMLHGALPSKTFEQNIKEIFHVN